VGLAIDSKMCINKRHGWNIGEPRGQNMTTVTDFWREIQSHFHQRQEIVAEKTGIVPQNGSKCGKILILHLICSRLKLL
jgi:hypothetical protein